MNKRRKSITRRVRSTRSGKYAGEEIKQYVAGLNELKNPEVSYTEKKAIIVNKSDRSLDDNLGNWRMTPVGDDSKRLFKGYFKSQSIDQRLAERRWRWKNRILPILLFFAWMIISWCFVQVMKRR